MEKDCTQRITVLILMMVLNSNIAYAVPFEIIAKHYGFYEIAMPGDGNCIFWAVAAGDNMSSNLSLTYNLARRQYELRKQVATEYRNGDFDEELSAVIASEGKQFPNKETYIDAIANDYYGGELEILALSKILHKNIVHHMQNRRALAYPDNVPYRKSIHIWYSGNHYNLLIPGEKK